MEYHILQHELEMMHPAYAQAIQLLNMKLNVKVLLVYGTQKH